MIYNQKKKYWHVVMINDDKKHHRRKLKVFHVVKINCLEFKRSL